MSIHRTLASALSTTWSRCQQQHRYNCLAYLCLFVSTASWVAYPVNSFQAEGRWVGRRAAYKPSSVGPVPSWRQRTGPVLRPRPPQLLTPSPNYLGSLTMARVSISDSFDGGNIEWVETAENEVEGNQDPTAQNLLVKLRIKPDVYTELERVQHAQYFCFRSTVSHLPRSSSIASCSTNLNDNKEKDGEIDRHGDQSLMVKYSIENAGQASFPSAWAGTTVFYSNNVADGNSWRRKLDTRYEGGKLTWTHRHDKNGSVYFSYFPPYAYVRHLDLIAQVSEYAQVQSLGQTLDGREMECISVGSGSRTCWVIHRQHPGESMAEYFAEGLLGRLLGLETCGEVDGKVRQVLDLYTFYIVPCMCPDGAVRGHIRTNGVGANLNREWADSGEYKAPTLGRSPEVYHVFNKMKETGVDCFIDVHGDEELPFNFLSGAEQTLNWGPRLQSLHGAFVAAYVRANPDMQSAVGYNPPPPNRPAATNIATKAVANTFNCLAVTLEMPFKDCLSNSGPEKGWSPQRSTMLGASLIDPLVYIHPYLRDETEFWIPLPAGDAYVRPSTKF